MYSAGRSGARQRRQLKTRRNALVLLLVLCFILYADYRIVRAPRGAVQPGGTDNHPPHSEDPIIPIPGGRDDDLPPPPPPPTSRPTNAPRTQPSSAPSTSTTPRPSRPPSAPVVTYGELPSEQAAFSEFYDALNLYERNLRSTLPEDEGGTPDQHTRDFKDIPEPVGYGVSLPYDPNYVEEDRRWQACAPRDADFTAERDELCTAYLSNPHNMRSIKPMASILTQGRTIKFKVFYRHGNLQAIVKMSQKKFFFEAMSEYLAYKVDRTLNLSRVPTTALVRMPLDYLRASIAYSPFFSQWFHGFVVDYNYTSKNLVTCDYPQAKHFREGYATSLAKMEAAQRAGGGGGGDGVSTDVTVDPEVAALLPKCTLVAVQLWMLDVHSALSTILAVPFEYDDKFARKYYVPGHALWPPKPQRLRAIGDLLDRFIFDFLIGNTDRGLNDHNNFVFGGCTAVTLCAPPPPEERTLGLAKYAFLDHGSSFHSTKEALDSPFRGVPSEIPICRYRRSMFDILHTYREKSPTRPSEPFVTSIRLSLPKGVFHVTRLSVFRKMQTRLEKIVGLMDACVEKYGEADVLSIPEYYDVSIKDEELIRLEAGARRHA